MRKTTVVTPTYNEAENIKKLIPILLNLPIENLHVLIVDDHSSDGTGEIADAFSREHPQVQVLHRPGKLGLGSAYIQGFQQALATGADYIVEMDADFSHPPEKIVELLNAIQSHDMVIGSRYVQGGAVDYDWPFWRKALSAFGNFYARTLLRMPVRDVTGGYRIFRAQTLRSMPLERVRSNGYIFQVEMAYIIHRLGMSIGEIPIYFAEREWGSSKMSFKIQIEAAFRTWALMFEYRDLKKPH